MERVGELAGGVADLEGREASWGIIGARGSGLLAWDDMP